MLIYLLSIMALKLLANPLYSNFLCHFLLCANFEIHSPSSFHFQTPHTPNPDLCYFLLSLMDQVLLSSCLSGCNGSEYTVNTQNNHLFFWWGQQLPLPEMVSPRVWKMDHQSGSAWMMQHKNHICVATELNQVSGLMSPVIRCFLIGPGVVIRMFLFLPKIVKMPKTKRRENVWFLVYFLVVFLIFACSMSKILKSRTDDVAEEKKNAGGIDYHHTRVQWRLCHYKVQPLCYICSKSMERGRQARDQLPPTYFFDYILISGQGDDQSRPDNGQMRGSRNQGSWGLFSEPIDQSSGLVGISYLNTSSNIQYMCNCGYFYTTKRILDKFVWLNMDVKILQRLHKKTERNNKLENINIIWRRCIKDKNKMITEKGRTAGMTVVFSPMGKEMLYLKAESRETDQKLDKRSFLRLFGKVDGDLEKGKEDQVIKDTGMTVQMNTQMYHSTLVVKLERFLEFSFPTKDDKQEVLSNFFFFFFMPRIHSIITSTILISLDTSIKNKPKLSLNTSLDTHQQHSHIPISIFYLSSSTFHVIPSSFWLGGLTCDPPLLVLQVTGQFAVRQIGGVGQISQDVDYIFVEFFGGQVETNLMIISLKQNGLIYFSLNLLNIPSSRVVEVLKLTQIHFFAIRRKKHSESQKFETQPQFSQKWGVSCQTPFDFFLIYFSSFTFLIVITLVFKFHLGHKSPLQDVLDSSVNDQVDMGFPLAPQEESRQAARNMIKKSNKKNSCHIRVPLNSAHSNKIGISYGLGHLSKMLIICQGVRLIHPSPYKYVEILLARDTNIFLFKIKVQLGTISIDAKSSFLRVDVVQVANRVLGVGVKYFSSEARPECKRSKMYFELFHLIGIHQRKNQIELTSPATSMHITLKQPSSNKPPNHGGVITKLLLSCSFIVTECDSILYPFYLNKNNTTPKIITDHSQGLSNILGLEFRVVFISLQGLSQGSSKNFHIRHVTIRYLSAFFLSLSSSPAENTRCSLWTRYLVSFLFLLSREHLLLCYLTSHFVPTTLGSVKAIPSPYTVLVRCELVTVVGGGGKHSEQKMLCLDRNSPDSLSKQATCTSCKIIHKPGNCNKKLAQLPAVEMQHAPAKVPSKIHILVESLLENGWSNNRIFLGLSACQLQAVEQVSFLQWGILIKDSQYLVSLVAKNHCSTFSQLNWRATTVTLFGKIEQHSIEDQCCYIWFMYLLNCDVPQNRELKKGYVKTIKGSDYQFKIDNNTKQICLQFHDEISNFHILLTASFCGPLIYKDSISTVLMNLSLGKISQMECLKERIRLLGVFVSVHINCCQLPELNVYRPKANLGVFKFCSRLKIFFKSDHPQGPY
ncbi:putative signal peptide protein [Puccinia sorghi]|uniref:Putative signal peptide protein n=1 Tax=Puccinia sorghi TaxID=27349 RepID=A0A0L6V6S9_9BASI|nr:putative signal peptide protein [Puccinia sorghi]